MKGKLAVKLRRIGVLPPSRFTLHVPRFPFHEYNPHRATPGAIMPSKLSPNSLNNAADVLRFVEAGSPLVKLTNHFGPAEALRAMRPDLLIIGRKTDKAFVLGQGTPEAAARAFVERQHQDYLTYPAITIWEGPNKPGFGSADDPSAVQLMAWYAVFEAERLRLLSEMSLRGVVGNFASGTPELPLWTAFLPALDAVERYQGYLGVHEYSSPWMWWLTGTYQPSDCNGRALPGEGETGWTTLRYRKVYNDILGPNGLGEVPLVISRCGLGRVGAASLCPGASDGAWKVHFDYWASQDGARDPIEYWRGPERDPERYYAEQLIWYDRELQKDAFVVGAAISVVGATEAWADFDIADTRVAQTLIDYIQHERWAALSRPQVTPPLSGEAAPDAVSFSLSAEPEASTEPETVTVPRGPAPATRPPGGAVSFALTLEAAPNLLINAGFEDGQAYYADDTHERAVPKGWVLDYASLDEPLEPGQSGPSGPPLTALINSHAVLTGDRERIFAGGDFCWKVAGMKTPFRLRLWQSLAELEPGRTYHFSVNVLPDPIIRLQPRPTHSAEPLTSEVRLIADVDDQTVDSGWKTGRETPFGRYSRLTLDFTPPADHAIVGVEIRCRYPLPFGAWYIDELSVTAA
jgi:hypothetical protein